MTEDAPKRKKKNKEGDLRKDSKPNRSKEEKKISNFAFGVGKHFGDSNSCGREVDEDESMRLLGLR